MAIMIVSSYLPFPLVNGGNIRLYNLLKFLSKKHAITLVCERRKFQTNKDVEEVKKYCKKVITVPRKKQWSFINILKSGFSLNPFLVVGHTSLEMKKEIEAELKLGNFDLIHVETFYVMQNLPKTNVTIVLAEHNIEYMVYKRFVDHSPFFLKPLLYWDVWKMKRVEKSSWRRATALIAVSGKEKELMKADSVIPNGVDIEKFKVKKINFDTEDKRVLFIGDFKWMENRDTARWILNEIWPRIKTTKDIKLWIVGRDMPDDIKKITDSKIIVDENSPLDAPFIYRNAFVLLAPIRIGGGTSFKILEALACGVPVVTTKLGAEGIGGEDEQNILTGETEEEIVGKIENLLMSKDLYEKISTNARKLIEERYSWNSIGEKLERVYEEVLND